MAPFGSHGLNLAAITAAICMGPEAHPDPARVECLLVILLAVPALVLSRVVDANKFSLHAMYRARLIRAFLGASRAAEERAPNRFTGFDENDELYMPELWPSVEAIVPGVAQAPNGSARPPKPSSAIWALSR